MTWARSYLGALSYLLRRQSVASIRTLRNSKLISRLQLMIGSITSTGQIWLTGFKIQQRRDLMNNYTSAVMWGRWQVPTFISRNLAALMTWIIAWWWWWEMRGKITKTAQVGIDRRSPKSWWVRPRRRAECRISQIKGHSLIWIPESSSQVKMM